LRELLCSGEYPSRNAAENLADIAAQQAAGTHGSKLLIQLTKLYPVSLLDQLMSRLLDIAAESVKRWIESLSDLPLRYEDALDDGTLIRVELSRDDDRLAIDFSGTAGVHVNGFNATPAIVTAAVLYVLRCLSGSQLPLNEGVMRQIDLRIPVGLLNPPANDDPYKCAAVVAGNVETSQRIVDVLLGALDAAAASQGTMNNVLMGDSTFGYYETIGGGSGATSIGAGASGVHTHMTNTRITDPEVLESRLPVRLIHFAIRSGSGGPGRHRGGDGLVRRFEFLRPLVVSLITNRRTVGPYGSNGGERGEPGANLLIQSTGKTKLPSATRIEVAAGDQLEIQTPGGGGWGVPESAGVSSVESSCSP
jgi:5-oxoprolinase (ATP-hydrolysing)